MLHFHGLVAARHAARVAGPPHTKPTTSKRKTAVRSIVWSRDRVLSELRKLARSGQGTTLTDLVEAGHVALVSAAREHAGGLAKARALAGLDKFSTRTTGHSRPHTKKSIIHEIRRRHRSGESLRPSGVPQHLYSAARYQFGSWPAAVAAARVTSSDFRPKLVKYTRKTIVDVLRRAAREGVPLTKHGLSSVIRINAVRREFGTLESALIEAGLTEALAERRHGAKVWDRTRLIETLRARAARGKHRLTPGLFRAVALHFGGAEEARRIAGVPSPTDIRIEQRRKAKKAIWITERERRRRRYE